MADKDIKVLINYIMEHMIFPYSYTVVPSVEMIGSIDLGEFGEFGYEVVINLLLPDNMQILLSIDGDDGYPTDIQTNHLLNGVGMDIGMWSDDEVYDYLLKYIDASVEQVVVPPYDLSNSKMLELYKEVFSY